MRMDGENLASYLPAYLTDDTKEELLGALKQFNSDGRYGEYYCASGSSPDMLQGDGWRGFWVADAYTLNRKCIQGVVLSNSCDVASENKRSMPSSVVFAPIIKLRNYASLLGEVAGLNDGQIESRLDSIRKQLVTAYFYLPSGPGVEDESIVVLDQAASQNVRRFVSSEDSLKSFQLSTFGFYLFIFKLSIHFCRLHERVDRTTASA